MPKFKIPGGFTSISVLGQTYAVDEDGYIDAGDAGPEILARLVQHVGATEAPSDEVALAEQRAAERAEKADLVAKLKAAGRKTDARANLDYLRGVWAEMQQVNAALEQLQKADAAAKAQADAAKAQADAAAKPAAAPAA